MSPAQAVPATPPEDRAPEERAAAASWIGPDLVTGEGIVSVDVTFLVRQALGSSGR
ncbi:hypothetical protein [Microbacterium luticocti]|uniref:hypothetical protein n=1 Tax=Microbacterium luticocti TaxID=451764 RepID=UPI000428E551|nr:hypothetical protein [Microbacterium luticocti]